MVNFIAQDCYVINSLPFEQVAKLLLIVYIYLAKTVLLAQVSKNVSMSRLNKTKSSSLLKISLIF